MYKLTLSPQEIQEITGYRRFTKQQESLRRQDIPFSTGLGNKPIVLRCRLHARVNAAQHADDPEPDFGVLENGKKTQKQRRQ